MHKVLIAGAGKIGSMIACILAQSKDYTVHLADLDFNSEDSSRLLSIMPSIQHTKLDITDISATVRFLKKENIEAVISSLPFFLTTAVATAARQANSHYFDLTEDVVTASEVKEIAEGASKAFVPQCGIAPGVINIIAHALIQSFEQSYNAYLRVGALPERTHNVFHYALTWSTEGLINEYANPCETIEEGKVVQVQPLDGLETVYLNGETYEAFNTSGGIGSLITRYQGRLNHLNYKTLRYPGHCEKMRLLMKDLHLDQKRAEFKTLLEQAIPKTYQDLVIIYVSVEGHENGVLLEKSYLKKIYPAEMNGLYWSAIQRCTGFGLCTIVDLVLKNENNYKGLIAQEDFSLESVKSNRFGNLF